MDKDNISAAVLVTKKGCLSDICTSNFVGGEHIRGRRLSTFLA